MKELDAASSLVTARNGRARRKSDASALTPAATAAFAQATDDAIFEIDDDLVIRAVNPAAAMLAGTQRVVGSRCDRVLRCHDAQGAVLCGTERCPLLDAQPPGRAKPANRATLALHTKRGERFASVVAITYGELEDRRRALLAHDVTRQIAAERARDVFLDEVAHKLRNRLNAIHGFIELVAGERVGPISEHQRELLGYAYTSSIDMTGDLDNLLSLMRQEDGTYALQTSAIAPTELLEEVVLYLALEASSAHVVLAAQAPDDLAEIVGDRYQLRRALINLTTNAIKFTPPGGSVALSAEEKADSIEFAVADSGIGIAPEDLPHIFERDYLSLRIAALGKNGSGMGLATVRLIAEQHGGTLRLDTAIDRGTTFYLCVPRVPPGT
jgi:two-component system phosphate regulon sensor histidine kinase PhoR